MKTKTIYKLVINAALCMPILLYGCVSRNATYPTGAYKQGKVFTVACKHDPSQSYACYLPRNYNSSKKYSILYGFSPNGRGAHIADFCKSACDKNDWILVASNNARNGPVAINMIATAAMWKDTHERFSIKANGCYATGFSGGSGMAFRMARDYERNFMGVIPMGVSSTWYTETPDIPKHISVYFIIGSKDGVRTVRKHAGVLKAKGNVIKVDVFPGGHRLPPKDVVRSAVDWMAKLEADNNLKELK